MPAYDFRCERCDNVRTLLFKSFDESERQSVWCDNPNCRPVVAGGVCRMVKMPSAPNFSVSGFNAKNGYSGKR